MLCLNSLLCLVLIDTQHCWFNQIILIIDKHNVHYVHIKKTVNLYFLVLTNVHFDFHIDFIN